MVFLYLLATTFTLQVSFLPVFKVAVIVVLPVFLAVTLPFLSTVAMDLFFELQLLTEPPLTDSFCVKPCVIVADFWLMVGVTFSC